MISRGENPTNLLIVLIVIQFLGPIDSAILSRNKTIISSSTYYTWEAQNAIDGNPRRDGTVCRCCPATWEDLTPWFELDLGKSYTVHRILVEGRETENGQHLNGMRIYLDRIDKINSNSSVASVTEDKYNFDYVLPTPKPTRFVSLALYNLTKTFTICELTVYGECVDGEFGDFCEHECHCGGDPCNKTTGVCPSGRCLPGYLGTACDNECYLGTYGVDCRETCGNCKGDGTCMETNGSCLAGCEPGYVGDTCKEVCTAGFYGENCGYECGHCFNGEPCDLETGVCRNGCSAGYQTRLCNTECIPGSYGDGCTMRCGACVNGTACNRIDGTCLFCAPGYFGKKCTSTENTEDQTTTDNVMLIVSGWVFGGVALLIAVGIVIAMRIRLRSTKQKPTLNDTRLYAIPNNSGNEDEHQYDSPTMNA